MTVEYEFRKPPRTDALVAATRSRADTWVYDIDRAYPPEQPVPSEAIVGSWEVDRLGNLTGRFARNDRYRPVERCTRLLKPYVHAAAKSNRDQWIVEIDERGESSFPDIPPHLVRGWWYVDADGRVSDQFRPNSLWQDDVDAVAVADR